MSHQQYERFMNQLWQRHQICQEQSLPLLREALLQEAKNAQERVMLQELFALYQIYVKKQLIVAVDRFREFIKLNFESHFYSANHYCGMRDRRQKLRAQSLVRAFKQQEQDLIKFGDEYCMSIDEEFDNIMREEATEIKETIQSICSMK